ncbi:MAG: hypothetical protein ACLGH0_01815, partial [Thermoanaerobaculia bacterium]
MATLFRGAVVLLVASTLFAQPSYFGPRVPLTETRYGSTAAIPRLASNGSELFVFWSAAHNVRVGRGDRIARPVLDASGEADVLWTGSELLVAAESNGRIVARRLDANGEPIGDAFDVIEGSRPRLAIHNGKVILLFEGTTGVQALVDGNVRTVTQAALDYDIAGNLAAIASKEAVTLLTLNDDASIASHTTIASGAKHVAIAGDGASRLVIWTRGEGLEAAVVNNGVAETPFTLSNEAIEWPSLAATANGYRASFVTNGEVRMLDVQPGPRLAAPAPAAPMSGAIEQALVASAFTENTALLVWNEDDDVRTGVWSASGWRELVLAENEEALAASRDGNGFTVLTQNDDGWTLRTLD